MRNYLLILCCLLSTSVFATIYRGVESNGTIVYSDTPLPHGDVVKVSDINTVPPPESSGEEKPVPAPTQDSPPLTTTAVDEVSTSSKTMVSDYEITIVQPTEGETIQNDRNVLVRLRITPELDSEDKAQLLLDGKPYGEPESKDSFTLIDIPRGTHQLQARIIDPEQKSKVSSSITFYVHQPSQLLSPR